MAIIHHVCRISDVVFILYNFLQWCEDQQAFGIDIRLSEETIRKYVTEVSLNAVKQRDLLGRQDEKE